MLPSEALAGAVPFGAPDLAPEMPGRPLRTAAIVGLGMAHPSGVIDNAAVSAATGVEESWIVRRTGVRERPVAGPGETTRSLATAAGAAALADAGIAAADLDLVIVATFTPDRAVPHVAPTVAADLGATPAGAFDVGAACTGWLTALATAAGLIETGRAGTALVIGADLVRRHVDDADRNTSSLFADGAGAAVVAASGTGAALGPLVLAADGTDGATELIASELDGVLHMDGHETFRRAVGAMAAAATTVVEEAGLTLADIDLVVPHQANSRICTAVAERLGLPPERVVDDIAFCGNTSAATLPIALTRARAAGRMPAGSRVVLAAFGSGLTWGAALLEVRA